MFYILTPTLLNEWVRSYHINNTKSYKHILAITTFFLRIQSAHFIG